jgi:hypothetical protein
MRPTSIQNVHNHIISFIVTRRKFPPSFTYHRMLPSNDVSSKPFKYSTRVILIPDQLLIKDFSVR